MITFGIIGTGRIGKIHMENICTRIPGARIKAAADPYMDDETKQWIAKKGIPVTWTDYRNILEDSEINAVVICSSTDTHAQISLDAIRAGKHVFCEKPIDHNLVRIREVINALKENSVKYQVGFNRRFDHNFEALKRIVQEEKLGSPHIIKVTSRDPQPPGAEYVAVSGGMFLDMTIHDFDMIRFLAGCDAEELYVQSDVLVDKEIGKAGDVDTAVITLKMKNGVIAVIDNSRRAVYGYDQRAEIFGSGGMAACVNDTASNVSVSTQTGVLLEKPLYFFLERYMDSFTKEIQSFVETIDTDGEPAVTVQDGMEAVLMGLAASRSVKEHRPVKLSEFI